MKRALLLGYMLLLALLSLNAQEFAIRQSDDLRLERFTFKVAGNLHIVFWSDLSEGHRVIWCQNIYSDNSVTVAPPVRLAHSSGDQNLLAVTPTTDGNFVALWEEMELDQIKKFKVQKMSPNGNPLWGELGLVVAHINSSRAGACLAKNSIGGAFVVFKKLFLQPVMAQNFDEHGNRLWAAEGKELLGDSVSFQLEEVVEDAAGGLILNTQHAQGNYWINKLHRFDPSGEPTGTDLIYLADYFQNKSYKIFPPQDGKFILCQKPIMNSNSLRIFKIDADGVPFTSTSQYIQIEDQYFNRFKSIVPTPEGGVAIAWFKKIGSSYSQHFVQKYSPSFEAEWSQPKAIFEGADELSLIDLLPSETGNLWLCCLDSYYPQTLRAQLIDKLGNPLFGAQGVHLCDADQQAVTVAGQNLGIFLYNSIESGFKKLKIKAYTHAGTQVQNDGEINLPSRLNNSCYIQGSYSLKDRFISLWTDLRDNYNLFYQIYDQDMNALFEPNGRAVCPTGISYIEVLDQVVTADNKLAFIYKADDYSSQPFQYFGYLQIIDAGGNLHYPEYGLQLDIENMQVIRLASLPDGILMSWLKNTAQGIQIRAQKYVNGQAQWESSGKLIYQALNNEDIYRLRITGDYIVWESFNINNSNTVCKALKVDDNGDPETGWDPTGVRLLADNDLTYEQLDHIGKVGDDLVAFLQIVDTSYEITRAQKLSSNAQRLWGDGGILISGIEDWSYIHSVVFGEDTYFLKNLFSNSLYLSKLDAQGTETQTAQITSGAYNWYDASLIRFGNGSMLCIYSDDDGMQSRDLYISHISSLGIPHEEAPIPFCTARHQQVYPKMAVFGNKAFISWRDERAGFFVNGVAASSIWGSSVLSVFTDVSDPSISPVLNPKITANYPNPFNPSTRISFELPTAGLVKLSVYNLKGQLLKTLINGNTFSAGSHSVIWDGRDHRGNTLSSGIYLGRLSCGNKSDTIKMVMVK